MNKIKSFFSSFFKFFSKNTDALVTAAIIAETATGNEELVLATKKAGKAISVGTTVLSNLDTESETK